MKFKVYKAVFATADDSVIGWVQRSKSMQKINYVSRANVLDFIRLMTENRPTPFGMDWGNVTEPQELIDAVNSLKRTSDDMIDMSRLAQCLQSFYTHKMIGPANRRLIRLWVLIKTETVRRYKHETRIVEKYKLP